MSTANDVEFIVNSFNQVNCNLNFELTFMGEGVSKPKLQEFKRSLQSRVKIKRGIGKNELHQCLHEYDVGIVSFRREPIFFENSPNKFFDYLSAGLPVIFTRSSWLDFLK